MLVNLYQSYSKCIHSIPDNPISGSWAELILLNDTLRKQDDDWINIDIPMKMEYTRLIACTRHFVSEVQRIHGELHCEYCNKSLIQQNIEGTLSMNVIATIDHFLPVSIYPHLMFHYPNFIISCHKHNKDKGTTIVSKDDILYPYDNTMIQPYRFRMKRKRAKICN